MTYGKKIGLWLLSLLFVPTALGQVDSAEANLPDSLFFHPDDPVIAMLDSMWNEWLYEENNFETDRDKLNIYGFAKDSVPWYPESVYHDRFAEMDGQSPFSFRYNASVARLTDLYVKRRRRYSGRLIGRSETYYPLFEETLDRYGMPLELKHLSIVESGLHATAKSRVGAMGLWQFMLATGKWMGLEVTSYIDERCDPILATDAACRYLKYLYGLYEDWDLALAAYNAGPGNVNKALRRAGGGKLTYWEVRPYLPKETQSYVPAFYAVNYMMNYSAEHNIFPVYPKIRYIQYDTVHVHQTVTMEQISKVLCVDYEMLVYLNPIYKTNVIPPPTAGKPRVLTLPVEKTGLFVLNEKYIYNYQETPDAELLAGQQGKMKVTHTVKKGEYITSIARMYKVTPEELTSWNGLLTDKVTPGQRLTLYTTHIPKENPETENPGTPSKTTSDNEYVYHIVQKGDTLWHIANKYDGVSIDQIRDLNADLDEKALHSGQRIKIKQKG